MKWHHSATECKSFTFLLLVRCVFGGTTHQDRDTAASEDPQLEAGVAAQTWGALSTPPEPYELKLFREIQYHLFYKPRRVCIYNLLCCFERMRYGEVVTHLQRPDEHH